MYYDPSTITGRTATQQAILDATSPIKADVASLAANTYRKTQTYTKQEVDDLIVDSQAGVLPLNVISTSLPNTGNVNMNSKKLISLAAGTSLTDGVNVGQLQTEVGKPKDRIVSVLSPEVNFAEITAAGGFQVTAAGLLSI